MSNRGELIVGLQLFALPYKKLAKRTSRASKPQAAAYRARIAFSMLHHYLPGRKTAEIARQSQVIRWLQDESLQVDMSRSASWKMGVTS